MNALESSQALENQGLLVTLSISSWKLSEAFQSFQPETPKVTSRL